MMEISKVMVYEVNKIEEIYEEIFGSIFEKGSYIKFYSFKYIINVFVVCIIFFQVFFLFIKMKEINLFLLVWFSVDWFSVIWELNNDVIYIL